MRPLPVSVIQSLDTAAQVTTARNIAIINIIWVAFLFLLHPVQYCRGGTDTAQHPLRLNYIQFFIGQQPYNAATVSNNVLAQADFVSFLFTTQKNCVKGESIGHGTPVTPKGVQWRLCVAEWHNFGAMAPPARRLYQVLRRPPSGKISEGTTSQPPLELLSEQQDQQSVSPRPTSVNCPYKQTGPWLSSWRK